MNTVMANNSYQTFVNDNLQLFAVIALDSTATLPAIGGCRCLEYPSHAAAIAEAIRLSQAMTLKARAHGLEHGGGKMVVALPKVYDRTAVMQQIGLWVESLAGAYITASDSGTNSADMDIIATTTKHVAAPSRWRQYNPSYYTALGVFSAITSTVDNLDQSKIIIQGIGEVGWHLLEMLSQTGAKVAVCEIDHQKLARASANFNLQILDPKSALFEPCDLLVPCALGGILNPITIPKIKAKMIVGAANNIFADPKQDALLAQRLGLQVVPDYIANGGGLIHVAGLYANKSEPEIIQHVQAIGSLAKQHLGQTCSSH